MQLFVCVSSYSSSTKWFERLWQQFLLTILPQNAINICHNCGKVQSHVNIFSQNSVEMNVWTYKEWFLIDCLSEEFKPLFFCLIQYFVFFFSRLVDDLKSTTLAQAVLFRRRALEIYEFEYRKNNKNNWISRHFMPIMMILLIAEKLRILEDPFEDKELSNNALIEKVLPTVLEKRELKNREFSKLTSLLGISGLSRFQRTDQGPRLHSPPQVERWCLSSFWKKSSL